MSTNCVKCVKNKRTGLDLLCDGCRASKATNRPRPWHWTPVYIDPKYGRVTTLADSDGRPIVGMCGLYDQPVGTTPNSPGARMIAAAPDLLEALKAMTAAAKHSGRAIGFDSRTFDAACAAIAKAEGTP